MTGGLLQSAFAVLVFVTVVLVAFAIGALVSFRDLKTAMKRPQFFGLLAVNVFIVPLLGLLAAQIAPLDPGIEAGLILCAICAGGPLGLKVSQLCNADLPWTLSLVVTLLLFNVASLPLWSMVLLDRVLTLNAGDLFGVLVVAILAPLLLGIGVKRRVSGTSPSWSDGATRVSNVTLVLAVAAGVAANAQDLINALSAGGILAAMTIVLISGLLGWLVPRAPDRRRASALVTLNRATSVALLVVGRAYVDNAEVFTAVVLFGVIQTVVAVALSLYWRLAERGFVFSSAATTSSAD
jgi:predicted Na+-dependent transporter